MNAVPKSYHFADVLSIVNGRNQKKVEATKGQYPIYGSGGIMGWANDYICPENTVIIGRKGSINNPIYVDRKFWNVDTAFGLVPNQNVLLPRYLFYFCVCFDFEKLNTTVTIPSLTKTNLLQIKMFLPPLGEQEKIICRLDKLCHLIELKKEQLKQLDVLAKSRFIEMFGDIVINNRNWPTYKLSALSTSRLGKMLDSKKQTGENTFPYLANFNVRWFEFDLSSMNQMDFSEADQAEFSLKDGDLLVCEGGEVGRCAVWHNQLQKCFYQKALHRVRCNTDRILPNYLAWWFKMQSDKDAFESISGAKATIAHLPGIKLKNLDVPLPPLPLQDEFAAFVEELDKSKFSLQKMIKKYNMLFDYCNIISILVNV